MHGDPRMERCDSRCRLPSPQQRAGIDGRDRPVGQIPSGPIGGLAPIQGKTEPRQARVNDLTRVMGVGVADENDGCWGSLDRRGVGQT